MAGARHLHVSSYFLVERSLGPGLAALLRQARAAGVTTSVDTNWDPSERWGGSQLRAVLAQADLLVPNEAEALRISGTQSLPEAAAALTATGSRLVVKRGSRGALCVEGGEQYNVGLPPVEPVDTTGAGDCFNAGLITGLLRGLALPQAAAIGCAAGLAGALAVSKLLGSMLFNVSATDPLILTGSIATMIVLSLIACAIPAQRAASANPVDALRSE